MTDAALAELDQAYTSVRLEVLRALQILGLDPRSGTAIGNRLGVNRQLAWQVSTIACQPAAAPGLAVMPGARGLNLFVEASGSGPNGVSEAELEPLRRAIDQLDKAIETHARDRPTLALLAATWERAEMESRTEDLRRDAHRAQCALLGARVETQIRGIIFAPSRQGRSDRVSMASYQCLRNITRIRSEHRSRLFYLELPRNDDGSWDMDPTLMRSFLADKFRLEADLSTGSADDLEYPVDRHRGWVVLRAGPVGHAASSTMVFTGMPTYENPRYIEDKNWSNQIAFSCLIPTETLLIDCLMDKSLAESATFRESLTMQCFDASTGHPMMPISNEDPAYLYDLNEIEPLGPELMGADPAYSKTDEIIARAAARAGSSIERLVGVRCRARYVIAPMSVVVTRRLADKAG